MLKVASWSHNGPLPPSPIKENPSGPSRRGERRVIALGREEAIPDGLVAYLNRLSDLFFVWSRHLHTATDTPEIPWESAP